MTTKFKKGAAMTSTAIIIGLGSFYGGWAAFNSKMAIDNATAQSAISVEIVNLKAAVGSIPAIQESIGQIKLDGAVTRTLLENLSKDRFQYPTEPSQQKVISQLVATSTP